MIHNSIWLILFYFICTNITIMIHHTSFSGVSAFVIVRHRITKLSSSSSSIQLFSDIQSSSTPNQHSCVYPKSSQQLSFYPSFLVDNKLSTRLYSSSSSSSSSTSQSSTINILAENNISRLATLQILLSKYGAPGSTGCFYKNGDLVPISSSLLDQRDTPELITTLVSSTSTSTSDNNNNNDDTTKVMKSYTANDDEIIDQFENLHPYLFPIAQSTKTGNVICAYRNPSTELYDPKSPWSIVESKVGEPGFQLLSLNSEHLMKRIACQCDNQLSESSNNSYTSENIDNDNISNDDAMFIINLYNDGLGQGLLKDTKLDVPYVIGSVEKLGYSVDKYILLRVGPFPDLYECMVQQHLGKKDEQSAIIAAEACNSKFSGYSSTFRSYSKLLCSLSNRNDESRDAARMCLRMPLSTIGISYNTIAEIVSIGQMQPKGQEPLLQQQNVAATDNDENDTNTMIAIGQMKEFYNLMKSVENDKEKDTNANANAATAAANNDNKSIQQNAIDDAQQILDNAVVNTIPWKTIRPSIAEQLIKANLYDFANFVTFFTR